MANDLDDEIYPNNDDLIVCRPVVKAVAGGTGLVTDTALTGRVDGIAFLSTSADALTATAIHASLSKTLTESPAGVYAAVLEGADKATHLAATPDNTTLYRHFTFGQDYHEVKSVIYRKTRTAA